MTADLDDDRRRRIYAVDLLKRADIKFDVGDIARAADIIRLVEADTADMLNRYALEVDSFHSVGGGFVRTGAEAITAGRHRPPFELFNNDGSVASRHYGDGTPIEGEQP